MLKIDLLPRQFGIARTNRKLLALVVLVLIGALVFCFVVFAKIKTDISNVQAQLDEVKPKADHVRELRSEKESKESDLQPIQDKLQFIAQADSSGRVFWDRFHEINKYIWERAQVLDFSITPGGGAGMGGGGMPGMGMPGMGMAAGGYGGGSASSSSSVRFTVAIHGTQEAGRFLLNLLRCPALTGISMSGVPAGKSVAGVGGTTQATFGGAPGMAGMPMAGMPGAGPAGMGPPMGGGPMSPTGGLAAGGSVEAGSPEEEIILQITASLTEPITTPQPGGAVPAFGGPGMGMPGMGMDMPGMGMPEGMGPPGGATPGAPGRAAPGEEESLEELEAEET